MRLTFGLAARGPAHPSSRSLRSLRSSPRSLRSAVLAVCLTGVLSIGIPFGLLLGKGAMVTVGASRQAATPAPQLAGCTDGKPITSRMVRPGQCVQVSGHGFGGHELIEVTESRRPGWRSYLRADGLGGFSWHYRLPATASAGADVLTFVGTNQATAPPMVFCPFMVAVG